MSDKSSRPPEYLRRGKRKPDPRRRRKGGTKLGQPASVDLPGPSPRGRSGASPGERVKAALKRRMSRSKSDY